MVWPAVTIGYFLGGIPTAYIIGRLMGRGDIRELGDGNPGAKNVFHVLGPEAGIAVFCLDAFKAAAAVFIAREADASLSVVMLTGIAVVMGHSFPIFLGFRGGEGMACIIGILMVLITIPMLVLGPPTLLTLAIRRNTEIALAVMFIPVAPLCLLLEEPPALAVYSIILPCLVAAIHFTRRYTRRARVV